MVAFKLNGKVNFAFFTPLKFLNRNGPECHFGRRIAHDACRLIADPRRIPHPESDTVLRPETMMSCVVAAFAIGRIPRPAESNIGIGLRFRTTVINVGRGTSSLICHSIAAPTVSAKQFSGRYPRKLSLYRTQMFCPDQDLVAFHIVIREFLILPVTAEHLARSDMRDLDGRVRKKGLVITRHAIMKTNLVKTAELVIAIGGKDLVELILIRQIAPPQHGFVIDADSIACRRNRRSQYGAGMLQYHAGDIDPAKR